MKVRIKSELPNNLFADRLELAGKTVPIKQVVLENGQVWPIELLEAEKGTTDEQ
jgi:hypothetical protein